MTRLQKMLGKIKTVEELAGVLNVPPAHLTMNIGVSKDNEHIIFCKRENCAICTWEGNKGCTVLGSDEITAYLNAEISSEKTDGEHSPVVKLRDSARKLMKTVVIEGFKQGYTAQTVYNHLDEYIDVLEDIGLFEENELRTYVATDLLEVLIEERKKTK